MVGNLRISFFHYLFIIFLLFNTQLKTSYGANLEGNIINIKYGSTGVIKYSLKDGKFNISQNGRDVILNAYIEAKNETQLLNAKSYQNITYFKKDVTDKFGNGIKHIIQYKGEGLPTLQHVIYTYDNRSYFLTELVIKGKKVRSNYLSPLMGEFKSLASFNKLRSLFVPFDNDAFVRYDAKEFKSGVALISSEIGTVYDENSGNALTFGSVEHGVWKSAVTTKAGFLEHKVSLYSGFSNKDITRDQHDHGYIDGKRICSAKFMVGYFDDWRNGLEEYGVLNRIAEEPIVFNWDKPTPVGWNSWGVLQEKINYNNTTKVVDFFADSLKGFRNGNNFFIDLDSYWDNMVKGGYEGDYTELKKFADYCKSKGLQPGIYWAPFTDWGFKSGAERRAEGSKYTFGQMWTKVNNAYHDFDGARALDPTHPGTQARIKLIIGKLKDCGFKMIKIDFLGHAAIEADAFYDKKVHTGMQAYAVGMKYLIDQLDGSMLIYAAISPNLASGRYVHMRRIACDAWKTIEHTEYTLNSLTYGWWQSKLYNYLDADHVVFGNETDGENRARLLSAVITGPLITGDDFSSTGKWSRTAKELLQNKEILNIVANGKAFTPLNGNTGLRANEVFFKKINGFYYIAVFNFDGSAKDVNINLIEAGLLSDKTYRFKDVFSDKFYDLAHKMSINVASKDALLLKLEL